MNTSKKIFAAAAAFGTAMSISAAASASVFAIDYHDAGVWNAFDSEAETYAMKYRSDQGKDGFWLVVSDGDNPKGDGESHAILYGDIANDRITAYTYTGENNSNSSYETGTLLGTYENAFSSGGTHPTYGYELTMFNLDVSAINGALGPDFDGVQLGEQAGIWFHQSAGSEFTYGADGSIVDYAFDSQMWLDRGGDDTNLRDNAICATSSVYWCATGTEVAGGSVGGGTSSGGGSVPAPGGLALLLVGLAGLGRKMRGKKA